MEKHPFDNDFTVTREQTEQFKRDGFVKLQGFLNADVIASLHDRVDVEMNPEPPKQSSFGAMFSRFEYDFETEKANVYAVLQRPYFRRALTDLTGRDLFLTSEVCFEIEKKASTGFPWHVDLESFGYQVAEEFACSLWIPLHRVDTKGQAGGMAYVPETVVSGKFLYRVDSTAASSIEAKERVGIRATAKEYDDPRVGILNSPTMTERLEQHRVEDDFEPGDALLFSKTAVHRTVMLGEGPIARRAAYVMRFVDAESRYNSWAAQWHEVLEETHGKGLFPYKPFNRQPIEIAEAGAREGERLAECAYFDNREKRTVRREQSPQPS